MSSTAHSDSLSLNKRAVHPQVKQVGYISNTHISTRNQGQMLISSPFALSASHGQKCCSSSPSQSAKDPHSPSSISPE